MPTRTTIVIIGGFLVLGAVAAGDASAAPPWRIAAPWTAGTANYVGGTGYFYGEGDHVDEDFYAVDVNGPGGGDDDCGQEIRATAAGTVVDVVLSDVGYGNQVLIDHGEGYSSRYAHLHEPVVAKDQVVAAGDLIGYMGSTGFSDYCHLHFVIYLNGQSIPPSPMSGVDLYDGILLKSDNDPEQVVEDEPPSGHLTSPHADARVHPGDRLLLQGEFRDDRGVAKVDFYVARSTGNFELVASDDHGSNGTYAAYWRVDFPSGTVLRFHAHVFDTAGQEVADTIDVIENVEVVPADKSHERKLRVVFDPEERTASGEVELVNEFNPCRDRVPLRVQRRVRGEWKAVASMKTTDSGLFIERIPKKKGRYRIYAPRVRVGDYSQHICLRAAAAVAVAPGPAASER